MRSEANFRLSECQPLPRLGSSPASPSAFWVIIPLTHNLHDYAMGSKHYTGPHVTSVGPYNHTLASPTASWLHDSVAELEFPLFVLNADDLYPSPVTVTVFEHSLLSLPDH